GALCSQPGERVLRDDEARVGLAEAPAQLRRVGHREPPVVCKDCPGRRGELGRQLLDLLDLLRLRHRVSWCRPGRSRKRRTPPQTAEASVPAGPRARRSLSRCLGRYLLRRITLAPLLSAARKDYGLETPIVNVDQRKYTREGAGERAAPAPCATLY